jgi:predicted transcriptional regulator
LSFGSTDHMLWWIFVGSKGGRMRAKLVKQIMERPMNANQLAQALNVNYRTVMHHIDILLKNNLISAEGPRYGTVYFPSKVLESNLQSLKRLVGETWASGVGRGEV